ncbi:MAG: heavy-metal-associated domain-containing protein [Clostridia bacterium]|nr:heavy-metal-associated domain-containing protein [Clostridia bacterium]
MTKTTVKIDGMMCGMCEAHVADVIRRNFTVKKVKASHIKGTAEIITETPISEELLKFEIEKTGYRVESVKSEDYQKKGLFSFLKK